VSRIVLGRDHPTLMVMMWSDGTHLDSAGRNKAQVVMAAWGKGGSCAAVGSMAPYDTSVSFMHLRLSCREPFSGTSANSKMLQTHCTTSKPTPNTRYVAAIVRHTPYNNNTHCHLPQASTKIQSLPDASINFGDAACCPAWHGAGCETAASCEPQVSAGMT